MGVCCAWHIATQGGLSFAVRFGDAARTRRGGVQELSPPPLPPHLHIQKSQKKEHGVPSYPATRAMRG